MKSNPVMARSARLLTKSIRRHSNGAAGSLYRPAAIVGRPYAPNGARECTRRLRQIAAGSLTAANGVVS